MLRFARLILIFGLLTSGVVMAQEGNTGESEWRVFHSKKGRFSAAFPGTPTKKETHTESFIGTTTNHIFVVWNDQRKFTVDYSDLPGLAVTFAGHDTIYNHTKGALLKKTLSKETSYEDITVQGIDGKRLAYDMPPIKGHPEMHGQAYLLLDDGRLYVFDAQLPVSDKEKAAQRFLSSIRIGK